MDTQKVISYLNKSAEIGSAEMVEITALKKQYPWFSALYQLEAKCLKNENKFGLKKSIKTASLFAGDREVLYDFMHDGVTFSAASPIKTDTRLNEKAVEKLDVSDVKTKPVEVIQKEETKEVEVKLVPQPESPVVEAKKEEPKSHPVDETGANSNEQTEKPIPKKPVKKQVKEPTIVYDPLLELQSKIIEPEIDVKPTKVYDPLVELPKLANEKTSKKRDKQDFFSWLDSLEDDQPIEEPKPRKLQMSAEASQLLENFIKNRPSISRIRTDVDRTEVHKTVKENSDNELVTESLAALHIKQGRPEKAIEIYEKLRLQNPQKFSYFAALIEKIKQENNIE